MYVMIVSGPAGGSVKFRVTGCVRLVYFRAMDSPLKLVLKAFNAYFQRLVQHFSAASVVSRLKSSWYTFQWLPQ